MPYKFNNSTQRHQPPPIESGWAITLSENYRSDKMLIERPKLFRRLSLIWKLAVIPSALEKGSGAFVPFCENHGLCTRRPTISKTTWFIGGRYSPRYIHEERVKSRYHSVMCFFLFIFCYSCRPVKIKFHVICLELSKLPSVRRCHRLRTGPETMLTCKNSLTQKRKHRDEVPSLFPLKFIFVS